MWSHLKLLMCMLHDHYNVKRVGMHVRVYAASRMWCLARLLPLMIGESVPEDDEKWKLFLTLLTIIDYVFAPRTDQETVSYLAVLPP